MSENRLAITIIISICLALVAVFTYLNMILFALLIPLGLGFLYLLLKCDKFLLATTIYVFIIDAGNGLLPIPLRELTFVILIAKLILSFIQGKFKDKTALPIVLIAVIIPIYGVVNSLLRGNNIAFAFDDAKGYIFLLTALGLYNLIRRDQSLYKHLIIHFIIGCLIVSGITLTIYGLSTIGVMNIYDGGLWLREYTLGFAGIEAFGQFRVFLRAQLYVMAAFIILVATYFGNKTKYKKTILLLITIFGLCLLASNTRGLWLGTLIGLFLLFFLTKITKKKLIIMYIAVLMAIPIFFVFQVQISAASDRLLSSFEFNNLQSNELRNQQLNFLLDEFESYPIFGKGFGATLESGFTRSEEAPYSFELSYFELLYKLGIVGVSIFALALLILVLNIGKTKMDTYLKKGILFSFIAFMVLSSTNPYIVSSLGMFMLVILYTFTKSKTSAPA